MNLFEILKNHAKCGDEFYSPAYGIVKFQGAFVDGTIQVDGPLGTYTLDSNGCLTNGGTTLLFPSKDAYINYVDKPIDAWQEWYKNNFIPQIGHYYLSNTGCALKYIEEKSGASKYKHEFLDLEYDITYSYTDKQIGDGFKTELIHFDISLFKPRDFILVRDDDDAEWSMAQFSHISKDGFIITFNGIKNMEAVPYNRDTKHLLGSTDDCRVGDKIYGIRIYNLSWNDCILTSCKKITSMRGDYNRIAIRLDYNFAYLNPTALSCRFKHNNWLFFADKEDFKNFIKEYLDVQSFAMQNLIKLSNEIDLL